MDTLDFEVRVTRAIERRFGAGTMGCEYRTNRLPKSTMVQVTDRETGSWILVCARDGVNRIEVLDEFDAA